METLKDELIERISKNGYLRLDEYVEQCLYNKKFGYYTTNIPIGFKKDFITSSEVSSLFGEMIACFFIDSWTKAFNKSKINLLELGAGNGRLLADMLKVFNHHKFLANLEVYILEVSQLLIEEQKKTLGSLASNVVWIENIAQLPKRPTFFLANEFFDALPIRGFENKNGEIFELVIKIKDNRFCLDKVKLNEKDSKLHLVANPNHLRNSILELSQKSSIYMEKICLQLAQFGGIALIIDYGYLKNPGNKLSLQAIKKHKKIHNFINLVAKCDLTSYVDFNNLINIAYRKLSNNMSLNLLTQRQFLINCGIIEKREKLLSSKTIIKEVDYLISEEKFGDFKTLIIAEKLK